LFEYGFAGSATNASILRDTTSRLRPRTYQYERSIPRRRFTTTRIQAEEVQADTQNVKGATAVEVESVVRQARQTFGETLPKDYLSTEEYALYERLYGPPLRETRPEDLEYLPDAEENLDQPRNTLLKEGPDGEFEEVEFDSELGFSVVENPVEDPDAVAELVEAAIDSSNDPEANPSSELSEAELERLEEELNSMATEDIEVVDGSTMDLAVEDTVHIQAKNQREIDAIKRLQKDMDTAMAQPVEEEDDIDEEFEEEEETFEEEGEEEEDPFENQYRGSDDIRTHPHTMTGRFGTQPSTLSLPQERFVEPISELLARTSLRHLTEASENAFGGKGLPFSASTPASKKVLGQKHIGLDATQHKMSEIEADAFLTAVVPGTYASVMSTLVEVRKRLGSGWIREMLLRRDGEAPRVLDAGAGGGGIIAWRDMLQAEWDIMKEEGLVTGDKAPHGKSTVLTGANTLRHRISRFLDDTTFLPRLPDYIHAANSEGHLDGAPAQGRKSYDIILAAHTLFPLKEDWRRKNKVQNLWSLLDPNGGVLVLLEKGIPWGFEAIAGARSHLLESHISSPGETEIENELQAPSSGRRFTVKEEGMIIAPCTNHKACPMYPTPGLTHSRKDFCHFKQRYIRPHFLQKVLGAAQRNHEDVKYSYVAVRRGIDARKGENPVVQGDEATDRAFEGYEESDLSDSGASDVKFHPLSLPRNILQPLKRRHHVTLDLCTPSGKLERWTVPRSFSRQAHRDARKARWGDLWALGAKTRVLRTPRLGRPSDERPGKYPMKGIRDGRMGKGGKKPKKNKFDLIMGEDGLESIVQDRSQTKYRMPEKRTKGGRIWKEPKPITEEDLG